MQPGWDRKLRFRGLGSIPASITGDQWMTLSQSFAPCLHPPSVKQEQGTHPMQGKGVRNVCEQHSGTQRGGNEDFCAKEVRDEDGAG